MLNRTLFSLALTMLMLSSVMTVEAYGQSTTLVTAKDLSYLGSFKVPVLPGDGLSYGGSALAFNSVNNSLYVVGHVYDQLTAELAIPQLGATATVIQPLTDSVGGKLSSVAPGDQVRIGGNLVYKNRLYVSAFDYYDGNGTQTLSHFSRPLTLSTNTVTGPYRVGPMGAGFYDGYMSSIPSDWQARLGGPALTGNCCISVISRTSYGPAAFSFDPEKPSANAQALVYYDSNHTTLGAYGASGSHPLFNGTTSITGVFFPPGTASVLFFGSTGIGNYCYGESAACGDPLGGSADKGDHAYPYKAYIWAYNASDLAAVRSGSRQPWEVTPYATWELNQFVNVSPSDATGGAAYDPATGRLYLSQRSGDGDLPLIHVYKVNVGAVNVGLVQPMPPTNVQVQ